MPVTRQEAIQWLYQNSQWKKNEWVENLGVSYAQLRKWISPEPVRISPTTIVKAAGLFSFGVEWLDLEQQKLNLYPISEELCFSTTMPFTAQSLQKLSKIDKPFKTEVAATAVISDENQQGWPPLHAFQTKTHTQTAIDLDVMADEIPVKETITIRISDSSMAPLLKPGMFLIAETKKKVSNGTLIAVSIAGNGFLIGEFFKKDNIILLIRLNARPIELNGDVIQDYYKITWINIR